MTRVMVVDDSFLQRKIIKNIFLHREVEIIEAVNGQDCLAKLAENKVDVILLDLLMPVMSGEETLKELINQNIKIPVIICSADIQQITRQICEDLGVFRFINKPPKENELLEAFDDALKIAVPAG